MATIVKRIFHPVGQGAFFTEQFFEGNNPVFTVAYDCGTFSGKLTSYKNVTSKVSDILANAIDSALQGRPLDVFFISHFDEDHVNGIPYLMGNNYITRNTRVIIPSFSPRTLRLLFGKKSVVHAVLDSLLENNIPIIIVNPRPEDEQSDREYVLDQDVLGGIAEVDSGTRFLTQKYFWEYTSFYLAPDAAVLATIFSKLTANDKSMLRSGKKLLEAYNTFRNTPNANKPNTVWQRLKNIYNTTGTQVSKTSLSLINVNSLMILSHAGNHHFVMRIAFCGQLCPCVVCKKIYNRLLRNTSCLYTGDTDFLNKNAYDRILDKVIAHIKKTSPKSAPLKRITFVQIPHHGSKNNYNNSMATDKRTLTAFTNYDPLTKRRFKFQKDIPIDFLVAGKPLFIVTANPCTEFRIEYEVQ